MGSVFKTIYHMLCIITLTQYILKFTLGVWRIHGIIFNIYGCQLCVYVSSEMLVFLFLGFRTSCESHKFISPLTLSLSTNKFFNYSVVTVEHNTCVPFSSKWTMPCTVEHETNFYTWKRIVGYVFWIILTNSLLGVKILGYFEEQCNRHIQWGIACWKNVK